MGLESEYKRQLRKNTLIFFILGLCLAAGLVYAVFSGYTDIQLPDLIHTLFPGSAPEGSNIISSRSMLIFTNIRLPRVALAVIAGAGLAVCGLVMQAITGNDMASPFTTGISSAAAFGAALGIVFSPFHLGTADTILFAFMFAVANYAVVYSLSSAGGMDPRSLILIGTALNYFFTAMNSALQFLLDSDTLATIVYWSFGSFLGAKWKTNLIIGGIVIAAVVFFQCQAVRYNVISSSDDESAVAMGVNVKRLRILSGGVVTVAVASIISFTGIIGFVGLIAPHICRIMLGGNHKVLIPASAMTGALIVLLADTVGRTWFSPATIPVGVVISFIGVPLFIMLLLRKQRGGRL